MWVAGNDVHTYFTTAEAKEKEALRDAMDDDVERIGSGYGASKERIGHAAGKRHPRIAPRKTHTTIRHSGGAKYGRFNSRLHRRGRGGRFGDARGTNAYLASYFNQGIGTASKLVRAKRQRYDRCAATPIGHLCNVGCAIIQELRLILLQPVTIGFHIAISSEGEQRQCGKKEHQQQRKEIPASLD